MKTPLKVYGVTKAEFDSYIMKYGPIIEKTDDICEYLCGYGHSPKKGLSKYIMLYGKKNGEDYLIMPEYRFDSAANTSWKQIVLHKQENIGKSDKQADVNGSAAYNWLMKIVSKYYAEEEIEKSFEEFSADFDENFRQFHFDYAPEISGRLIYEITNCVKYDINGAHCKALCEIFPRCESEFAKFYKARKKNPKIKKLFNYAVGMLKRKGREGTYHWVVQRTTERLLEAIQYVGGELIYANTDSLVVKGPARFLEASQELGEFKKEFEGNVFFYQDKNYNLYQFGDQLVGRAWQEVRSDIDLSEGQVVHYDISYDKIPLKEGYYAEEHLENIQKEKLKIWRI